MSSSFENPFIPKPDNLKPDSAEFLQKFAGASDEQLKKAGLSDSYEEKTQEIDSGIDHLKKAVSDEEKSVYENELVDYGGVQLRRIDAKPLDEIVKKLNKIRVAEGQPRIGFGQEIKTDRLQIGGKTKKQLKQELQAAYIDIRDDAQEMLDSPEFEPLIEVEDSVLVRLTVADLGFAQGATVEEIYQRAQELGLDLCPPETGPLLCVKKDTEQRFGKRLNIAMKQLPGFHSTPLIFYLYRGRDAGKRTIGANWAYPTNKLNETDAPLVFRVRFAKSDELASGKVI